MMNDLVKVEGHPGLVRNQSGAIVNTDRDAFAAYIKNRDNKIALENRVGQLEDKLDLILKLLQEKK